MKSVKSVDEYPNRFCEAAQLCYWDTGGARPPLLLIHGWSAFKQMWAPIVPDLARHFRVIVPDLPGHGGSPLAAAYTLDAFVARLEALIAALDLRRFALVGHSMGALIATTLTLAEQTRVTRLALVSPVFQIGQLPRWVRILSAPHRRWTALAAVRLGARVVAALDARLTIASRIPPWFNALRTAEWLTRYAALWLQNDPLAVDAMADFLRSNRLFFRIGELRVPAMVIGTWLDPLVAPRRARAIARAIPGARLVFIRNATHNPMDERAARLAQIVGGFCTTP